MSILTIRFISGLLWHNFWHLPSQLCVARAGCCGHAPVRGVCAILSAAFRVSQVVALWEHDPDEVNHSTGVIGQVKEEEDTGDWYPRG